jgi:Asp-tRNA(Asn)/Glu-tRNA(Gln) amidotransferase A subunit family amidase
MAKETRRKFLATVPAAVAGATVASKVFAQGQGPQAPAGPISAETIECAEKIPGLDFHTEEEAAMARGLNQNLATYTRLRNVKIGPEIDPAIVFKPNLPGHEPKGPATPGAKFTYTKPPMTLKRPANLEDVAFWPVTHLAALIERRLVTSTELTQMYLARLKRYQPTLNFYVTLTEELALKQAAQADAEIKAGKYRGPLHGMPWGGKDLLATKGIKTTWGGEPYVEQVFDYDATVVERLTNAGAVLCAKLTLGALAQGDQWFGGQTKNPWNGRGSSGSSAGPGSATAAGCVAFAIGTETQGSIISPSTANGVVGLRPTYGRVSRFGAMALSNTMDKLGPMCRYVEDTMLVLNVIYGPDGRDNSVANAALSWNPAQPLAGIKIGYVRAEFEPAAASAPAAGAAAPAGGAGRGGAPAGGGRGGGLTPEQQAERRANYDAVIATYKKLGAKIEPVDLPDLSISQAIGFILTTESAASFDDVTRSGDVDLLATGTSKSTWPNTFKTARFVPAVEYIRAQRARVLLMREFDKLMSQYAVVLHAGSDQTLSTTNLTGHPAMAVKCGIVANSPQILMLTGRLYDEGTMARVAMAFEQATEWKDRHPKMA